MTRNTFVLKVQRELCHPKGYRKVSALSKNGPLVGRIIQTANGSRQFFRTAHSLKNRDGLARNCSQFCSTGVCGLIDRADQSWQMVSAYKDSEKFLMSVRGMNKRTRSAKTVDMKQRVKILKNTPCVAFPENFCRTYDVFCPIDKIIYCSLDTSKGDDINKYCLWVSQQYWQWWTDEDLLYKEKQNTTQRTQHTNWTG